METIYASMCRLQQCYAGTYCSWILYQCTKKLPVPEKNEIGKILSQFLSTFVTEILLLPMFLYEILKQAL
jgi:hypothetical protein